jgi:hypothetical protein
MATIMAELGYTEALPMERLLIEHIGACWVELQVIEHSFLVHLSEGGSSLVWHDKRLTSAQNRYLKAIETLARVRRLARVTPLQLNIGGQQVNVAGGDQ